MMVVWSLFYGSGLMVNPWAEAGHTCYCFNFEDEDHGSYKDVAVRHENIHYVNAWINSSFARRAIRGKWPKPDIIFAFPPCTDMASSGARWFASKLAADPECQNKAVATARIAEYLANYFGAPYMVENPRSVLSSLWRKPNKIFHPWHYGGYLPEDDVHPNFPQYIKARDAYPKETWLWTGNGFKMPEAKAVPLDDGYSEQYSRLGGKTARTKLIRSLTPRGFAIAVCEANYGG
ncbi:DNA methyltransferase [Klebsiella phage VLCpiS11a]|uniref:DNA methyltransferase n=1 Tax=Klebsiella phage VLCpiS11a TaxID=2874884 RepID=UPI0022DCDC53|nr:DNA methyltransferase [Klebsiella phage VLCpiS11a]UVX30687.1 DNA methyltransferase [Klebsiella phage VLCpiS11a]